MEKKDYTISALKKCLRYLNLNEQVYVISSYFYNLSQNEIMEKYNIGSLVDFRIVAKSADLKLKILNSDYNNLTFLEKDLFNEYKGKTYDEIAFEDLNYFVWEREGNGRIDQTAKANKKPTVSVINLGIYPFDSKQTNTNVEKIKQSNSYDYQNDIKLTNTDKKSTRGDKKMSEKLNSGDENLVKRTIQMYIDKSPNLKYLITHPEVVVKNLEHFKQEDQIILIYSCAIYGAPFMTSTMIAEKFGLSLSAINQRKNRAFQIINLLESDINQLSNQDLIKYLKYKDAKYPVLTAENYSKFTSIAVSKNVKKAKNDKADLNKSNNIESISIADKDVTNPAVEDKFNYVNVQDNSREQKENSVVDYSNEIDKIGDKSQNFTTQIKYEDKENIEPVDENSEFEKIHINEQELEEIYSKSTDNLQIFIDLFNKTNEYNLGIICNYIKRKKGLTSEQIDFLFEKYYEDKNKGVPLENSIARTILITSFDNLIKKSLQAYSNYPDFEDLVSIGRIGLINAVDIYDINMGVKFITLAYTMIWRNVQHHFVVQNRKITIYTPGVMPLESKPIGEKDETDKEFGEYLTDDNSNFVDDVLNKEVVRDVLSYLPPKLQFVLIRKFGFYGEEITLSDIGEEMGGLSRERVRQLISKALNKMKIVLNTDRRNLRKLKRYSILTPEECDNILNHLNSSHLQVNSSNLKKN